MYVLTFVESMWGPLPSKALAALLCTIKPWASFCRKNLPVEPGVWGMCAEQVEVWNVGMYHDMAVCWQTCMVLYEFACLSAGIILENPSLTPVKCVASPLCGSSLGFGLISGDHELLD